MKNNKNTQNYVLKEKIFLNPPKIEVVGIFSPNYYI